MIEIVIIGRNEGESVGAMYNSLQHFPAKRVWVLDRCTDDSKKKLKKLKEFYVETPSDIEGRQTSFARNLGLSFCSDDVSVLFLDGDRFVSDGDLNGLFSWEPDIGLLMLESDKRDEIVDYKATYGHVMNGFYSCGIFFKRKAIDRILAFQDKELFRVNLQSDWGIEDTCLGDVCFHLGLTADLYRNCRLKGCFDKLFLDSLDVMERRFKIRDGLNVIW